MVEGILAYERGLFLWINSSHTPFLDKIMWFFAGVLIWCPLVLVPLYCFLRRRKDSILVALSVGVVTSFCCITTAFFFKPYFARLRPVNHPDFMDYVTTLYNYNAGGLYGFISGHSANAFGFAVLSILLMKNRIYTLFILLWAVMMGYSRIYLGVHFVSDVIAGFLVGSLLGWLVYMLYKYGVNHFLTPNASKVV